MKDMPLSRFVILIFKATLMKANSDLLHFLKIKREIKELVKTRIKKI